MSENDYPEFLETLSETVKDAPVVIDLAGANEELRQSFAQTYGGINLRKIAEGMPVQVRGEAE